MLKKSLILLFLGMCVIGFSMESVAASDWAWGTLVIPKLGRTLEIAPNYAYQHYCAWKHIDSYFPGNSEGKRTGLWGHHTTEGAAFGNIEALNAGDTVSINDYINHIRYTYILYNRYVDANANHPSFEVQDNGLVLATCWASSGPNAEIYSLFRPDANTQKLIDIQFDGNYYLNKYGDVRNAGVNPSVHYLSYGEGENRYPNQLLDDLGFDRAWYWNENEDVRNAGVDPTVHYMIHGRSEGRAAHG